MQSALHSACPQAAEYTKEMLIEDFGIGTVVWIFSVIVPLYGACKDATVRLHSFVYA
jgi:hypothetical protein